MRDSRKRGARRPADCATRAPLLRVARRASDTVDLVRIWLGVLIVAACGRIGFDVVGAGDADGSGSGDANGSGSGSAACRMLDCAAAGGTCMGDQCVIAVTGGGTVTCPFGLDCVINCNTPAACRGGNIDCSMAEHCTINCNAGGTCSNETFACAGGCTIYCRVDNTCNSDMFQCPAGACDLECCNSNAACSGNSGTVPNFGTCP